MNARTNLKLRSPIRSSEEKYQLQLQKQHFGQSDDSTKIISAPAILELIRGLCALKEIRSSRWSDHQCGDSIKLNNQNYSVIMMDMPPTSDPEPPKESPVELEESKQEEPKFFEVRVTPFHGVIVQKRPIDLSKDEPEAEEPIDLPGGFFDMIRRALSLMMP